MTPIRFQIPRGLLRRLVAGAVFGLYTGHLLFYLNPQMDSSTGRLAAVTFLYALLGAAVFGTLLWLLRLLRRKIIPPGEPRQHGFGIIAFSVFFSALLYWSHLATLRIYLPKQTVDMLANAATIIGAASFVLFLLWLIERNASRRTSDLILACGVALVLLSVFFLHQRRAIYPPEVVATEVATVAPAPKERRVVVIGVEYLPFDWIVTIRGETTLPWFEAMSERSFIGRVEAFPTTTSRALWASLATGKLPYRHGVTGRWAYHTLINREGEDLLMLPNGINFRRWGLLPPIERSTAHLPTGRAIPFWSIFERVGRKSAVINWPSTEIPRSEVSLYIPSRFLRNGTDAARAEVRPGTLIPELRALARMERLQLSAEVREPFESLSAPLGGVALDALARDRVAARMAIRSSSLTDLDLIAVSLDGLGQLQSALDLRDGTLPDRASVAGGAMRAYIDQLDLILQEIAAAFPDADLYLVSPCGPDPPHIPSDPLDFVQTWLEIEEPGSTDGILVISGPGVAIPENPPAAETVDFVPTLLFASGLPVARDMDGGVLTDAFTPSFLATHGLSLIPSYEAQRLVIRGRE
ncbi:MAG TPA: alkaline phosphatase family protein [Thermoanaerobaculia bacterium]|nr:alkaline phosphatase family protein [Thermoanaerobaculia bacterium]